MSIFVYGIRKLTKQKPIRSSSSPSHLSAPMYHIPATATYHAPTTTTYQAPDIHIPYHPDIPYPGTALYMGFTTLTGRLHILRNTSLTRTDEQIKTSLKVHIKICKAYTRKPASFTDRGITQESRLSVPRTACF